MLMTPIPRCCFDYFCTNYGKTIWIIFSIGNFLIMKKQMNMRYRLLSSLIIFLYLASICAVSSSCSNQNIKRQDDEVIPEDSPWYSSELMVYGDYPEKDYLCPFIINDQFRVFLHEYNNTIEDVFSLDIYDKDTKTQHCIPINNNLSELKIVYYQLLPFEREDGISISVKYEGYENEKVVIYDIDLESNSLNERKTITFDREYVGVYFDKILKSDGYYYALYSFLEGDYYHYGFKVFTDDWESVYEQTVDGQIEKWSVCENGEIRAFETVNGKEEVIGVNILENKNYKLKIDEEILEKYRYGYFMDDGRIYYQNTNMTITCFDFNTNTEYVAIDYNNCDANISQLSNYTLFYADGNLFSFVKSTFYFGEERVSNVVLDVYRESDNPNKGKTVLYAAPSGMLDPMEGEGILNYNRNNSNYYVKVTMDYSIYNSEKNANYASANEYWSQYYKTNNSVIDALIQDIINNCGPDILLDFGKYNIINSSDYLFDLSEVTKQLDKDEYFTNIIEAYRVNNEIYQIPLTAIVTGIYIDQEIIDDEIQEFNFESYNDFINGVCKGTDPIGTRLGRNNYLRLLLQYHYLELHDKNGFITLNNETFYKICDYVKNSPEDMSDIASPISYISLSLFGYDLSSMTIKENGGVLLGFPSSSIKGPMVECSQSVAISKCTRHRDASGEFAATLLSYNTQVKTMSSNPINRKAFVEIAEKALPYSNTAIENDSHQKNYYSMAIIEVYESYLSKANVVGYLDTYTMLIINEEIQPYYFDQKDLDAIIPIIEKRVNLMLEERI